MPSMARPGCIAGMDTGSPGGRIHPRGVSYIRARHERPIRPRSADGTLFRTSRSGDVALPRTSTDSGDTCGHACLVGHRIQHRWPAGRSRRAIRDWRGRSPAADHRRWTSRRNVRAAMSPRAHGHHGRPRGVSLGAGLRSPSRHRYARRASPRRVGPSRPSTVAPTGQHPHRLTFRTVFRGHNV